MQLKTYLVIANTAVEPIMWQSGKQHQNVLPAISYNSCISHSPLHNHVTSEWV